ncbi:MAG TPA: hypothetical protein VN729_06745 [Ktedonobacteraceae bacterium]|nr:hypothetical protein [Ktedonobacteraceae bacterium]
MHGFVAVFALSLGGKPPAAAMLEGGGAALAGVACQRRTTSFQHRRRRRLTSHPLGWEALAERIYEWLSDILLDSLLSTWYISNSPMMDKLHWRSCEDAFFYLCVGIKGRFLFGVRAGLRKKEKEECNTWRSLTYFF